MFSSLAFYEDLESEFFEIKNINAYRRKTTQKQKKKYCPLLHNMLRLLTESIQTPHLTGSTNITAISSKCSV